MHKSAISITALICLTLLVDSTVVGNCNTLECDKTCVISYGWCQFGSGVWFTLGWARTECNLRLPPGRAEGAPKAGHFLIYDECDPECIYDEPTPGDVDIHKSTTPATLDTKCYLTT